MKKILLTLCALSLCLLTACLDFCGFTHGDAYSTYDFSYTNPDGTTTTGSFVTNEVGQGAFDVNEGIDCSKVTINKRVREAMDEMLDL